MAKTKSDIVALGKAARYENRNNIDAETRLSNPYKPDSWQANAWSDGYREASRELSSHAAEAGRGQQASDAKLLSDLGVSELAPFPVRMPSPTREHVSRLNYMACSTKDSSRALKLDAKISKLYQRWAQ